MIAISETSIPVCTYADIINILLQMWVLLYRKDSMAAHVQTTNAVESKNREVKYDYLKKKGNRNLVGVITTLVSQYLPDLFER